MRTVMSTLKQISNKEARPLRAPDPVSPIRRVLVCGGRDWRDVGLVVSTLNCLNATRGPFERLIDGGARGVDRMAGKWARDNGVLEWQFLPEWHRVDTAEGATRNQRMIAEATPDLVVAFPGGLGTADMVERAKGNGIKVIEVG
jgi:hypothetical protein